MNNEKHRAICPTCDNVIVIFEKGRTSCPYCKSIITIVGKPVIKLYTETHPAIYY